MSLNLLIIDDKDINFEYLMFDPFSSQPPKQLNNILMHLRNSSCEVVTVRLFTKVPDKDIFIKISLSCRDEFHHF